jgi:hypothetical protein
MNFHLRRKRKEKEEGKVEEKIVLFKPPILFTGSRIGEKRGFIEATVTTEVLLLQN